MKLIFPFLLIVVISINAIGQTNIPQLVSFSAVVRDGNNQPVADTPVSIRLTFRENGQTGPLVYCALHQTTTNQNGFMSLQLNRDILGTGCNGAPSTAFENIAWENGGFWMEVEYQVTPGDPFENLGQLELASSFYAFAAGTAESISGMELNGASNGDVLTYNITSGLWEPMPSGVGFSGDYNDLTNQPTIPTNTGDLTNNSGFITNPNDADSDPTNELQDWSNLPNIPADFSDNIDDVDDADSDPTNELQNWSNLPNIPADFSDNIDDVNDADADSTNELQNLSVSTSGDTLYLQNGGFVIIPGISAANAPALEIGDSYQGGIIFYLDGLGGGLIAALADQSSASGAPWGCPDSIQFAYGTAIGTGAQNTNDIYNGCPESGTAADICVNLVLSGYTDWFLPSKDELNLMYQNIGQGNALGLGNVGGFSDGLYWSSTEYDDTYARQILFNNGSIYNGFKFLSYNVRAVRAF